MDIFFCDECAARVTDADLHHGHGIKKGDVVVCGSCIEKGLGLDRLSQVGAEVEAAVSQPELEGAGVLDEARDRVRTSLADPDGFVDLPEAVESSIEPESKVEQPIDDDSRLVVPAVRDPFSDRDEDLPIPVKCRDHERVPYEERRHTRRRHRFCGAQFGRSHQFRHEKTFHPIAKLSIR